MVRFILIIMLTGLTSFGLLSYKEYQLLVEQLATQQMFNEVQDSMK